MKRLLVIACAAGLQSHAFSADWTSTKGFSVGAIYTDNVDLAETDKQSDLIWVFTPRFTLRGAGARANVDVAAILELNSYGQGSDAFAPQVRAHLDTELAKDFFYFDANLTADQNTIDPLRSSGWDRLDRADNTTTTWNLDLSPYVRGRFKDVADLEARYTHSRQYNTNDENSYSNALYGDLASGTAFSRASWGLNADYEKRVYEEGGENEWKSADARAGYRIDRSWKLNGSIGYERNDYQSSSDTDGNRWRLGVLWTPSPRISLDVGVTDRYFGRSPDLRFSYRHKRSAFNATYSEELTDTAGLYRARDSFLAPTDPFGASVDPTAEESTSTANLTTREDDVFLDERFTASYTLKGSRTTFNLAGDHSRQTDQETGETDVLMGARVSLNRRISGKFSANAAVDWERSETEDQDGSDSDEYRASVGFSRALGPHTRVSLSYAYSERDSELEGDSYQENWVNLSLSADL